MIHISMFEYNSKLIMGIIYFLTFHYLDILTIFFLYTQALVLSRASTPQFLFRHVQCVFQNIHSRNKPCLFLLKEHTGHLTDQEKLKRAGLYNKEKHQIKRENLALHVNDRKNMY